MSAVLALFHPDPLERQAQTSLEVEASPGFAEFPNGLS